MKQTNFSSRQNKNERNYKEEKIIPLDKPLSIIYANKKEIFLEEGIAYQIAKKMGKIPPHQLRKILNEVKSATVMCKQGKFNEAKNKLYYIVPLTAYNAGRISNLKPLYEFVVKHINEETITKQEDIQILDQLFTSIIAYHKYLSEK